MPRIATSLVMLGALALGSLLVGLAPVAAGQSAAPKVLRVWWSSEMPELLEPQTNEYGIIDLTQLNYEGLTRWDEDQQIAPAAAESWEFNADGTVITFHLREGLTYSDGSPLTAERFRYAIERRCDPHLTSSGASSLFDVAGCEALNLSLSGGDGTPIAAEAAYEVAKANLGVRAPDDRTLEISLTHPTPYFPLLTASLSFFPVKQELVEGRGPEIWLDPAIWIGNGPFQVTGIAADGITLAANERHWSGRPKLDGITYAIMDYDLQLDAYQRGELDIISADLDLLGQLESDPVLSRELVALPFSYVDIFNFNLTREPFQDKKVREAFALAFDREAYCHEVGDSCTPHLSWIPPGVPGHIETDAYSFDPKRARQALAESTYGGPEKLPEIVWYYTDDDPWEYEQATWLAAQFRDVLGVEMTLKLVTVAEEETMLGAASTWPQFTNTGWWSELPDPHHWMSWWTCDSTFFAVESGYCNPAYDAVVAEAEQEFDPEMRIALAEESQRLLMADAPAIFSFTWDTIVLIKPYVTGYSVNFPNQAWPGSATPHTVDFTGAD